MNKREKKVWEVARNHTKRGTIYEIRFPFVNYISERTTKKVFFYCLPLLFTRGSTAFYSAIYSVIRKHGIQGSLPDATAGLTHILITCIEDDARAAAELKPFLLPLQQETPADTSMQPITCGPEEPHRRGAGLVPRPDGRGEVQRRAAPPRQGRSCF